MNYKKYMAMLMVSVSLAGLAAANYTGNYTVGDLDDIMIDNVATAMVAVKSEIPNMVSLGILWIILAMFVSIISMALAIFLIVPTKVKKMGGRSRT